MRTADMRCPRRFRGMSTRFDLRVQHAYPLLRNNPPRRAPRPVANLAVMMTLGAESTDADFSAVNGRMRRPAHRWLLFIQVDLAPCFGCFSLVALTGRVKKNDGPIEGRLSLARVVAPPVCPQGGRVNRSDGQRCSVAASPGREVAPHLGVFTRAERRISRQAPDWAPRECSRKIARDDLRDVSIAASLPDGHLLVYVSTVDGRKQEVIGQSILAISC